MKYSLPNSADDLLIKDGKLLMRSLSVYELLRRFGHIIRLTPFRFEDFSAALSANEQSSLIDEIHIQLLKTLIREDRQQQTWLGPPDLKDSVNVYLLMADHVTWPAALRIYLSADPVTNAHILDKLGGAKVNNYPFQASLPDKLDVLEQLCDQFLLSNLAREAIVNGNNGVERHDTSCRLCSKLNGDLIACGNCPAVYHLKCSDPPLENYPNPGDGDETYLCAICRLNHVKGVSDCLGINEDSGNLKRLEVIGMDKSGRNYWFLVRRLFVVDENEEDVRYFTTTQQLQEIFDNLKEHRSEKNLINCLVEHRDEIERQMKITQDLYINLMNGHKKEDGSYSQYLGQDGLYKSYVNHYSSNNLALSKNQHSERDINRSLGIKFSINSLNSFKWSGAINGPLTTITATIRSSILKLEATLPTTFIHPCWQVQKSTWQRSINYGQDPSDYAIALSLLESCIKPVLYKSAWYDSIGFSQLFRSTSAEREELKKTDRQPRGFERREWFSQDFELSYRLGTMVKFSANLKPVKHQVWKQKGEEYRLTGLNAWYWRSCTYVSRPCPRPKLYLNENYRWSSIMSCHPFVVDMLNEKINSVDVIDVASHLSLEENKRLLYPKLSLMSAYKRKRIEKLEGLLKLKLTDIEKSKLAEQNKEKSIVNVKMENGDSQAKLTDVDTSVKDPTFQPISNGLGHDKAAPTTKIIFYSSDQNPHNRSGITVGSRINILTNVGQGPVNQQTLKKCVLAKPKLPPCHDFLTKRSKIRSMLVLPDLELHKLARSGGLKETKSFSYTAKQNSYVWPYGMTPRPTFRTCWLYKNRVINSMQDVALQFKVIFACIRWDDLQARPPASGHNVIVTDDSNVTIHLLKKRDKLPYLTHSEYLIKKVMTPIEQPTKYRKVGPKKVTPSARSGLRARRQVEPEEEKGPTTEEVWVPEDQLELWELKQFDEKIERQNQLMRERAIKEEAERRRRLEDEKRRKLELERRKQRAEEEAKRAAKSTPTALSATKQNPTTPTGITQPRSLPTTPVLRYFRTEQGQIIRLPASYLQRGTPLILRHVGPGPNQTNTYIIRPQITPVTTNLVVGGTPNPTPTTSTSPVATPIETPKKPVETQEETK